MAETQLDIFQRIFRGGDPFQAASDLITSPTSRENQIHEGLEGLIGQLLNAQQQGQVRHDSALGRILGRLDRNQRDFDSTQRQLTQRTFAADNDRITQASQGSQRAARAALGLSGVGATSGSAQGLLQRIEQNRRSEVTGAKRDTEIAAANRRLSFNQTQFQNTFGAAQFENEGNPNELLGADAFAFLTNTRFGQSGIDVTREAGHKSRKAAKRAGTLGAIGGILGGLF